ncbi:MAG: galactitol-1-phosphate 5-dehydrogenase [Eubacteriales bacterium]|nr:galactitol-1-phosphate 5-dehydrogenase [Eubacteriales bacterium]
MKAWILHDINDFKYGEVPKPDFDDSKVIVKVKAAGICGSDIPRAFETGAHVKPLIIGHEFSGQVVETSKEDSHWLGKRVGIFPLIPCEKCVPCRKKLYEMCRNYSYLGSRCDGGFAEYVAVPKWNLIELPENVSFEQAAMLEPMAVAVHAMRKGFSLMNKSEIENANVAVCGLGTIGLLLVMFLRQAGVKNILAIGNKESQKIHLQALGISSGNYCDCRQDDVKEFLMDKTNASGVDLFFECVGKNETISQGVETVTPGGSMVLVGNPYSDMAFDKNTYWKILRNQIRITGTWNSSFTGDGNDDWHYVLSSLEKGQIEPEKLITHQFKLEDLMDGFLIMRDKLEDYIKVMVTI